ncbi:MAG: M24 family metallopeptidase [Acetobacteraceae bacterium]
MGKPQGRDAERRDSMRQRPASALPGVTDLAMALHFTAEEFHERQRRVAAVLVARGLDALLMFQQESMYYLTGYDSFGFCFFQCLVFGAGGRLALLARSADLRQAERTSLVHDIRIWPDAADADPARQLRELLESLGLRGSRIGIETATSGLTYANGLALARALDGFCTLEAADHLVDRLRAVKSDAELAYVRRAGELADDALEAALGEIAPEVDEGRIPAEMQAAVLAGGGDYPANEFVIGSDADALLCRYKSGRARLAAEDQLTLELAGVYRHYHAALMRTVLIGRPMPQLERMHAACREALAACESVLRPGCSAGDVFAAHAQVIDRFGMATARLNACGCSLGARFAPSWMDAPMCYRDNPEPLLPGMVMFLHMVLTDTPSASAMTLGRTYILTDGAPQPLSRVPLDLLLC